MSGAVEWVTFQGSPRVLGDYIESLTLGPTSNSPSVSSIHSTVTELPLNLRLSSGVGNTLVNETDPGPGTWAAHILEKRKRNRSTATWDIIQFRCGKIGAVALAPGGYRRGVGGCEWA